MELFYIYRAKNNVGRLFQICVTLYNRNFGEIKRSTGVVERLFYTLIHVGSYGEEPHELYRWHEQYYDTTINLIYSLEK